MACRLFGAKPLPEPMLAYCQLDSWEQISVKFESELYHFHSIKSISKCCLPKWRPFCLGRDMLHTNDPVEAEKYQAIIYPMFTAQCVWWRQGYVITFHDYMLNIITHPFLPLCGMSGLMGIPRPCWWKWYLMLKYACKDHGLLVLIKSLNLIPATWQFPPESDF